MRIRQQGSGFGALLLPACTLHAIWKSNSSDATLLLTISSTAKQLGELLRYLGQGAKEARCTLRLGEVGVLLQLWRQKVRKPAANPAAVKRFVHELVTEVSDFKELGIAKFVAKYFGLWGHCGACRVWLDAA